MMGSEGQNREDFWIQGPYSWKIRGHRWARSTNSREIFLIHGYSEHSLRYEPFVNFFLERDFNVTAIDLPGHGESDGQRASIDDFNDYLLTLDCARHHCANFWKEKKVYCFAHSLGALVALRYSETCEKLPWKKLACSSPLLGLSGYPAAFLPLLSRLANILPNWIWEQKRLSGFGLTHDESRVEGRLKDPLIKPAVSIFWVREILKARVLAFQDRERISIPVFIFQAGDERITNRNEARRFAALLSRFQKSNGYKEYPGWYHELSNEVDRIVFFSDLLAWYESP